MVDVPRGSLFLGDKIDAADHKRAHDPVMYDAANPRMRPVSDFELGQPGEGDVK